MATSFCHNTYRFALRSLPAATAATAAVALAIQPARNGDRAAAAADGGPRTLARAGETLLRRPAPFSSSPSRRAAAALCEAPHPPAPRASGAAEPAYRPVDPAEPVADPVETASSDGRKAEAKVGMWGEEGDGLYHGLFPRRQLWRPRLEYPLWDDDWDGRRPRSVASSGDDGAEGGSGGDTPRMTEAERDRHIRKNGVTRHIILVRHGQYDETHKEDSRRLLTPLGRRQAELTGRRLGQLVRGAADEFGPCRVRVIRVSDMARAKETADIIYDNMGMDDFDGEAVERAEPDPLLNEGRPCHHIPGGKARPSVVEGTDKHHHRIEQAFRKYIFRADAPEFPLAKVAGGDDPQASPASDDPNTRPPSPAPAPDGDAAGRRLSPHPRHEFEVIVCHGNVIRYFVCRALQLPPEAWLRLCTFNCSLTYLSVRPTGTVSCRMMGDVGHLPYGMCTFSMHSGFNW